jgi:AraC family transcriptional regulator
LERGIVERFDEVCRKPDEFPLSYTEALTSMLLIEVFRAHAAHPLPLQSHRGVGMARFKLVLDYIEEHLDHDIGLFELASLAGLSVTHFAHAFKATYHVPPYRYILERRIARAKVLLCTTNETIAMIAARVGFPSQSRFSQLFSRLTGLTPSNYRATGSRIRAA